MPLYSSLGQAGPLGAIGDNFSARLKALGTTLPVYLASMFANGEKGWVRIPLRGVGEVYQERTGALATTPCASGDPVGTFKDLITGGYWTTSADVKRPTFTVASGKPKMTYDGAATAMSTTAAINWGTDKAYLIEALEVEVVGTQVVTELSVSGVLNEQTFWSTQGESAVNGRAGWGMNGSNAGAGLPSGRADTSGGALPRKYVGECLYDLAGTSHATCMFPRINGSVPSLTDAGAANPGGGTFGNYVAFDGARGGTSLYFKGSKGASLCINRDPTAAEKAFLRALFTSLIP